MIIDPSKDIRICTNPNKNTRYQIFGIDDKYTIYKEGVVIQKDLSADQTVRWLAEIQETSIEKELDEKIMEIAAAIYNSDRIEDDCEWKDVIDEIRAPYIKFARAALAVIKKI